MLPRPTRSFYSGKVPTNRFALAASRREHDHLTDAIVDFENSDEDGGSDDDDTDILFTVHQNPDNNYQEAGKSRNELPDKNQDDEGDVEYVESEESGPPSDEEDSEEEEGSEEGSEEEEGEEDSGEDKRDNTHVCRWRKKRYPTPPTTYTGDPFPEPPDENISPYEYFKMFFDNELFQHIADQTNIYSVQQDGKSVNTTSDEIEKFLGVLLTMSYIKLPTQRLYWSERLRIPSIADLMSLKRFERLKRYIHFNDNHDPKQLPSTHVDHDKLFKVRPLIDSVVQKCRAVPAEENNSIDEQIIPTKGRSSLRQYLPKKKKWGIKVWARCGHSGIVYDYEVYTGKKSKKQEKKEIPDILMGGNVVYRLTRTLQKNKNFKVFFDNFFSSINLMVMLKKENIWATGTVRKDGLAGAKDHLSTKKTLKSKGRGTLDHVVDVNSGVTIVQWLDNNVVHLMSNYTGSELGTQAKRWDKKKVFLQIDRPRIVEDYNQHMGGVDLMDMLLSTYRVRQRTIKYYMHIFYYLLGISINNGWLLYRRHKDQEMVPKKQQLSLLDFHVAVADCLCKANKGISTPARGPGRPSLSSQAQKSLKRRPPKLADPEVDIRHDQIGHFPAFDEKQERCRKCKSHTAVFCKKCKVSLCMVRKRMCFNEYHGVQ